MQTQTKIYIIYSTSFYWLLSYLQMPYDRELSGDSELGQKSCSCTNTWTTMTDKLHVIIDPSIVSYLHPADSDITPNQ